MPAKLAIAPDAHAYKYTIASKCIRLNTVKVHKEFHRQSKLYYKALA